MSAAMVIQPNLRSTAGVANTQRYHFALPFHMVWLATNLCNARCLHCSSNSSRAGPDELSTEEAIQMIDQLATCGVVDLACSGGEPLMRPDLFEVLAHARSRGLAVGVGTNGSTLTPAQARTLAALGIGRLQVSLDGFAASHDALRRWPGLFARALKTIRTASEAGLRVHVCCTINRLNAESLIEFTAFVRTLEISRLNFSRYIPTGRGTDLLDLADGAWRSIVTLVAALRREYSGHLDIVTHLAQQVLVDDETAAQRAFVGCQAGAGQGCVTADGTILPCVLLPVRVGNLRETSFVEAWTSSPVIRALQDRSALTGRCGRCSRKSYCGGCRAVALARTGDWTAEDPRCWVEDVENVCAGREV
jgi:radical SAM protein with 4Fe4S-binding SPASM domain